MVKVEVATEACENARIVQNTYVVGEPASMDVFQFNYYVDVAMIDTKELPGVLTFVFGAVSSRWIETNLAPSFIEAKIRKYVETFEAHTANELLQKLEKIGRSDCEGNYRLPEQPLTLSLAPFLGLIR